MLKKILALCLSILLIFTTTMPTSAAVQPIKLSSTSKKLYITQYDNRTTYGKGKIYIKKDTNVEVISTTYTSKDTNIATVSKSGIISVKNPGKVKIIAVVKYKKDGKKYAKQLICTVNVLEKDKRSKEVAAEKEEINVTESNPVTKYSLHFNVTDSRMAKITINNKNYEFNNSNTIEYQLDGDYNEPVITCDNGTIIKKASSIVEYSNNEQTATIDYDIELEKIKPVYKHSINFTVNDNKDVNINLNGENYLINGSKTIEYQLDEYSQPQITCDEGKIDFTLLSSNHNELTGEEFYTYDCNITTNEPVVESTKMTGNITVDNIDFDTEIITTTTTNYDGSKEINVKEYIYPYNEIIVDETTVIDKDGNEEIINSTKNDVTELVQNDKNIIYGIQFNKITQEEEIGGAIYKKDEFTTISEDWEYGTIELNNQIYDGHRTIETTIYDDTQGNQSGSTITTYYLQDGTELYSENTGYTVNNDKAKSFYNINYNFKTLIQLLHEIK